MSENTQHPTSLPRRIFGIDDSPSKVVEEFHGVTGSSQQVSGGRRVSFSNVHRRPSVIGRWRTSTDDEEAAAISPSPRPAIPSALQAPGEVYTTPLPVLSMIVLSIVCSQARRWSNNPWLRLIYRLCLGSFCRLTFPHHLYCSWWMVRDLHKFCN